MRIADALRHQRFGTFKSCTMSLAFFSAQRLTASEVWHLIALQISSSYNVCSTPYGIRGLALGIDGNGDGGAFVLNALRHQRFGTAHSCLLVSWLIAVLNALRHQRFGTAPAWPGGYPFFWCSTPYGIRGLALASIGPCATGWLMCSTPYGIRGLAQVYLLTCLRFKNRAQRLTASEVWHLSVPGNVLIGGNVTCSTPYGIRGLAPPPTG